MNYVEKLRKFADYLEQRPELVEKLGTWDYPTGSIWAKDWDEFQAFAKMLGGYKKGGYSGTLSAQHSESENDEYTFFMTIHVGDICERVVKTDEEGEPILKPKREYVETGDFEPEYEYKCPSVWSD